MAMDMDSLSSKESAVNPSNTLDKKKSVIMNVRNHEAEFIDVPSENDVGAAFCLAQSGKGVAVGVAGKVVAVGNDIVGPDPLSSCLEAGG